jgi:hypothetical protein
MAVSQGDEVIDILIQLLTSRLGADEPGKLETSQRDEVIDILIQLLTSRLGAHEPGKLETNLRHHLRQPSCCAQRTTFL